MSVSLLDEKENVNSANECVKQDTSFTTSSILKPSQKENVLQLTPKKAPKVSFVALFMILHNFVYFESLLEVHISAYFSRVVIYSSFIEWKLIYFHIISSRIVVRLSKVQLISNLSCP